MSRAELAAQQRTALPLVRVRQHFAARTTAGSQISAALRECERSFLKFLPYWHFLNRETGEDATFAKVWPGQRKLAGAYLEHPWVYALKAGKLGFSELECAYDGWALRFRQRNARVHVFSRVGTAAVELADMVRYGMERLPDWMRLPIMSDERGGDTGVSTKWYAGAGDTRLLRAYPATPNVSIEATCQHAHIDEYARMQYGARLLPAVQSTIAPAGTCHIVTRGAGPNFAGELYRRALQGQADFRPFFAPWSERPDRDAAWFLTQQRNYPRKSDLQHFAPASWEEALAGDEGYVFDGEDLERAQVEAWGPHRREQGKGYCTFWDIGRHHDAAVGLTICYTVRPWQVVKYERLRGVPYPALGQYITATAVEYGVDPYIEANGPGEAVAENLGIKSRAVPTTGRNKPIMVTTLQWLFQQALLRYSAEAWPQLDLELRGYMWDDSELVQDSVIALAGATYWAGREREEDVEAGADYRANLSPWDR